MTKCKDERIGVGGNPGQPTFKIPLSSIKYIMSVLRSVFLIPDTPLPIITADELAIGTLFRSGVSRTDTAARVITQKSNAGITTGVAEDGSENISNKKDRIMVEEIMRELQTKAMIDIVIPIGALSLTTSPSQPDIVLANSAGSVTGTIINTINIKARGILR